ncbi:Tyrosine kinase specific for activated (GTP-bound) p21cdc42Hs [Plasmopara halstedii]|uniref:Tyrosine kinase specific for activated (GTP-bound) p21cdc42Hs n=1 Tax=Plasmopara halstedii TaxID=4781 RepID=A0A0P1A9M3_PLAHL|nr:Tyrosine kinase specific for activated (GTP-bound) p21cdc42Hs [Plasmopara halstedii]CEG36876.1 Tyrosine kinase specific for activated (GTP-bound) p21cdc42Hs [Plasmopara halstedii]|eukprot:XP_024573245.1 Tyrosine kinase specific for activated (GTP-bound) p21cdc42Hs [Plasmopara halstedii]
MPSLISETHYNLIRDALFDNDRDRVAELLAVPGININQLDGGGQTLLHLASFWGRLNLTRLLLAAGASVDIKNAVGCTALDVAIYWGHSAVAEAIQQRGGLSAWEEKVSQLQTELENAILRSHQFEIQKNDKSCQLEIIQHEFECIQTQLAEEKSAHLRTSTSYQHTCNLLNSKLESHQQLEQERGSLIETIEALKAAQTHSESSCARLQDEMMALKAQRDAVLVRMQASVKRQEEVSYGWQRAETAATIADTQRNFALAERDKLHRLHLATLAELLVTTERLGAVEDELMKLKTDLAEYIFDMKRAQRRKKHAAHALAPAFRPNSKVVEKKVVNDSKARQAEDVDHIVEDLDVKKSTFSLAAREFGDRLRIEEQQKYRIRSQLQDKVKEKYEAHASQALVMDIQNFQKDFETAVRALESSRSEMWQQLKIERDELARYATETLVRSNSASLSPYSCSSEGSLETMITEKYSNHALSLPQIATVESVTSCMELSSRGGIATKHAIESRPMLPIV